MEDHLRLTIRSEETVHILRAIIPRDVQFGAVDVPKGLSDGFGNGLYAAATAGLNVLSLHGLKKATAPPPYQGAVLFHSNRLALRATGVN
jgi:hypothetical protein